MHEMRVVTLGLDTDRNEPLLVLREVAGERRLLPIWIGRPEAEAIESERRHAASPRPLTHQLVGRIAESFARRLERVRLTEVRHEQVEAELVFDGGRTVDCRASDAVAVALHLEAPIEATEALLDDAGLPGIEITGSEPGAADPPVGSDPPAGSGPLSHEQQDESVREFREFLDEVTPEDFEEH